MVTGLAESTSGTGGKDKSAMPWSKSELVEVEDEAYELEVVEE